MIDNQSEVEERTDAIVIYKYLIIYNQFENIIKDIFAASFKSLSNDVKNRIAYYVGWLGSETKYIEYDTYSIRQDVHKYDENTLVSKLKINQIIKIDKREKLISRFSFEISSITKKQVTFLSHDCFLCLINMRNKLAHEILKINFKNSDLIEQLPINIISNCQDEWLKNIGIENISQESICILSNYIYMQQIIEKLKREDS